MSSFANRTPTLGLNYGSQAGENFNWSKLDETVANAFQPGSPLQIPPTVILPPGSVPTTALVPGATVAQIVEDLSVPTTVIPLGIPTEVAHIDYATTRLGPLFIAGILSLTLANTGASAVACSFQVRTHAPNAFRSVNFFATVLPGSKLPLAIPITTVVRPVVVAAPFASVEVVKTVGADATVILQAEDGRLTVTELA